MADDTPTVAAARRAYTQARTEWYELPVRDDNAEDVLAFHVAMDEALDALIAAVRAEEQAALMAERPTEPLKLNLYGRACYRAGQQSVTVSTGKPGTVGEHPHQRQREENRKLTKAALSDLDQRQDHPNE